MGSAPLPTAVTEWVSFEQPLQLPVMQLRISYRKRRLSSADLFRSPRNNSHGRLHTRTVPHSTMVQCSDGD